MESDTNQVRRERGLIRATPYGTLPHKFRTVGSVEQEVSVVQHQTFNLSVNGHILQICEIKYTVLDVAHPKNWNAIDSGICLTRCAVFKHSRNACDGCHYITIRQIRYINGGLGKLSALPLFAEAGYSVEVYNSGIRIFLTPISRQAA